ncbi:LOW QUALITY PROTEIN: protocadherin gamma-C5-like [Bombina bombina]|uniref:LOW QUALITY PROTEIN: protocadherin gamma-C5-like n=1 Tax=Bombina bombina TaxID=8345 RepID=UPI00235A7786|nr:LOW QUALITY PROTEIN: protocadherin gamma-C5-like [Bombina bombina]
MDTRSPLNTWKWQVISFFLCSWGWVSGQHRYSIVEESDPGTLIGNVAQDLGINPADINKRQMVLRSEGSSRFFTVKSGALIVNERIDRESLCGSSSICLLYLEIIAENPLELFSLEIEILDVNDNSPTFLNANQIIQILEIVANPGNKFHLQTAKDQDVGINGVTQYRLNPNPYFSLSVKNRKDGTLIPELVLEKILDREEKREHRLILTASDGGENPQTGSCEVTVIVLDINDNAPVFDQSTYKISLLENLPLNTVIIKLNATDLDEGSNGDVQYSFVQNTLDTATEIFDLNPQTGEIFVKGNIDFEKSQIYELNVRAQDKGVPELEGRCLIQIEVQDENDNTPEILFTSKTNEIPENAPLGTVVGFISVRDKDSGRNGEIKLDVSPNIPFKCKSINNRYSLVTSGHLDRERVTQYTIQLTVSDLGSPPLYNKTVIILNISDINDNRPAFLQPVYNAFINENNEPGHLLCTVSATDPDEGVNSDVSYSVVESQIDGSAVSSCVYINSQNGNIYSQRAFDYEQIQVLQITVRVEDAGFPKLFSNVSVFIFIMDANDNTPSILYPHYSADLIYQENIPRSGSVGYLVTKVSAVDRDSGQNAWLVYSILQSSSNSLFQISTYSGEIRTLRDIHETDNNEQQLVVLVSDHGEPQLSATITIHVNIIDNIINEGPKSQDFLTNSKPTPDITLYLIISLVAISLVSVVTFVILLVKCLKQGNYDNSCGSCFSNKSQHKQYAGEYQPTLFLNTWNLKIHGSENGTYRTSRAMLPGLFPYSIRKQ